jgi:hypothetical protein
MGVVINAEFKARDTIVALRELLVKASKGQIESLAFYAELKGGRQKTGFTGKYRNNPAEAVKVANRMSVRLNEINDAHEAARLNR